MSMELSCCGASVYQKEKVLKRACAVVNQEGGTGRKMKKTKGIQEGRKKSQVFAGAGYHA